MFRMPGAEGVVDEGVGKVYKYIRKGWVKIINARDEEELKPGFEGFVEVGGGVAEVVAGGEVEED